MKVRVNSVYTYDPAGFDLFDARTTLKQGDKVRVKNLSGCPPANTMGHCHVVDPGTGKFIGMVCTGSLKRGRT